LEAGPESRWFNALIGNRDYSSGAIRRWLAEREINAGIPYRLDEHAAAGYARAMYREPGVVERTINRLKRYRRIPTRLEKLASKVSGDDHQCMYPAEDPALQTGPRTPGSESVP